MRMDFPRGLGPHTCFAVLATSVAGVAIIELWIAATTGGTNDVDSWLAFADAIRTVGLDSIYGTQEWPTVPGFEFNHGPVTAWALGLSAPALETSEFDRMLVRIPAIVAHGASTLLVWRLVALRTTRRRALVSALVVATSPALILVAGFHGNTDPVFVAFTLGSALGLATGRPRLAGALFAVAVAIKIVPLVVLPAFVFSIGIAADRMRFLASAALASAVVWVPHLVLEPSDLAREVFLYSSAQGWSVMGSDAIRAILDVNPIASIVWIGSLGLLIVWVSHRTSHGPFALERATALSLLLFLALAPGFGVQYLTWPIAFLVVAAPAVGFAYGVGAGAAMFAAYDWWSGPGFGIDHANSWIAVPFWNVQTTVLMQVMWGGIVVATYLLFLQWRVSGPEAESTRPAGQSVDSSVTRSTNERQVR